MAGLPQAEQPPEGLDAYWLGVWRHGLKVMKDQGTWSWEQRPLLDEYVFALVDAQLARLNGERTAWDKATKRAQSLADQLVLTVRSRKANGISDDNGEDEIDPFAEADELAERRSKRAS